MSLKRYIAYCTSFITYLTLPSNKEIKLVFEGKDALTKQRFVDVEDPIIQKLLEENKSFGVYYGLSPEHIEENTAPSPTSEETMDFENAAAAKLWINKNHKVSYKKLNNKAEIVDQYEALGIKIKFIND